MNKMIKNFLIFLVVFFLVAAIFSGLGQFSQEEEKMGLGELVNKVKQEEVSQIVVKGNELEVSLKDGSSKISKKEAGEPLSQTLSNMGVSSERISGLDIKIQSEEGFGYWAANILPYLLPFLILGVIIYFMMRSVQGANSRAMMFGQSQAKQVDRQNQKKKVTFKDVAGAKEAKEELKEVVQFLKNPTKFQKLGATIPKGFLLLGSPGTGKTLMARAVAGEADVPYFYISGSEFVEMFVGVGASRVRDLFKQAKKNTPCIIFIDEIDAVGRKRGTGMGGSHDEREQTLNQILGEMDGFDPETNIIVIAATNRPDVLDPALLRPGRFDRQVVIEEPDIKEREGILKVHARKKPLAETVDLGKVAERTPGFSGAELSNLLNEAAILAARKDKKKIETEDIFEAIEKVMMGPERKSRVMSEKEKKITAYHEGGHALVAHFLPNTDPVRKVSIIARGRAGGYTLKLPTQDKRMHPKSEFIEELAVLLAGYMTEKEVFGEVTTGATSDLRRATNLARSLITDYGMSEKLGARTFGSKEEMVFLGKEIHEQRDYSEKTAEMIDEEVTAFINKAGEKARELITSKREVLDNIFKELMEKETLEQEEFEKIVGKKNN
ncbi:MAG: ATP-dependent zinc metalloprotease FtsH [Patescibacteria group bacterium]